VDGWPPDFLISWRSKGGGGVRQRQAAEEEEEVCSFGFRELCRKYKLRIHDSQANRGEAGASRDGCRLLTDWRSG
jgi:hypothetical protein